MSPSKDYPRMMFHRIQDPVIINSRDEEDALGPDWARTVWPAVAEPPAEPPDAPPVEETEEEPDEEELTEQFWPPEQPAPEPAPSAFEPEPRIPRKRPAAKKAAAAKKATRGRAGGSHSRTKD